MKQIFTFIFTFMVMYGVPAFGAAASEYIPEAPHGQKSVYDEVSNTVTISGVTPTMTEYDWDDWYEPQKNLPYVSFILIEKSVRNSDGTSSDSRTELTRIHNPELGQMFTYVDTDVEPDKNYEYVLWTYVDDTPSQYSSTTAVYTGIVPGMLKSFDASVANYTDNSVNICVTAPEISESGNPLTSDMSIVIEQSSDFSYTPIHVIENVLPGQTYTWRHEGLDMNKSYHYRAHARTGSAGNGGGLDASVFVGLDIPGMPENLLCVPESNGARITWNHASKGSRGGSFDTETTTYTIKRIFNDDTEEIAATNISGTEYFDNPGYDEACTITYVVSARNSAGESYKEAEHPAISFGRPAELPFSESFSDMSMSHRGWLMETTQDDDYYNYDAWRFPDGAYQFYLPTDEYLTFAPQDEDNGMACCLFYGYSEEGQTETMVSPAINVEGVNAVDFSFYYFQMSSEASLNEIKAAVSRDNGEWEELYNFVPTSDVQPEWKGVNLPISLDNTNSASTMRVRLQAIRRAEGPVANVYLDNIKVTQRVESGIDETEMTESASVVKYYNMQGIMVPAGDLVPGIYIKSHNGKTTKIVVK